MIARRAGVALVVVGSLQLAASPAAADHEQGRHRKHHMIAIAAGIALYASSETLFKDAISPDHCRWCEANGLDRNVREAVVWNDRQRANLFSNITGYALGPLAVTGLLVASSSGVGDRWTRLTDDFIPVFEAVVATELVTQLVKISAARQRPYARFATEPVPDSPENNLSFFSGHSSLGFSIAVSAGVVAQRRGYRLAPAIWATGLALAGTTAYLRVAADRHYFTDVTTGGVVGAAFGFLVPQLAGSLPDRIAIAPSSNGLAIVGTF